MDISGMGLPETQSETIRPREPCPMALDAMMSASLVSGISVIFSIRAARREPEKRPGPLQSFSVMPAAFARRAASSMVSGEKPVTSDMRENSLRPSRRRPYSSAALTRAPLASPSIRWYPYVFLSDISMRDA